MRSKKKVIHAKRIGHRIRYTTISIPQDFSIELRRLKDIYSDVWGERVSYETILSRLLSRTGLGSVDPNVYARFIKEKEPQATRSTQKGQSTSKKGSTTKPVGRHKKPVEQTRQEEATVTEAFIQTEDGNPVKKATRKKTSKKTTDQYEWVGSLYDTDAGTKQE